MLTFYLGALVFGIGARAIQLLSGGNDSGDLDAGGGDVHAGDHPAGQGSDGGAWAGWSLVASVRFWSFALLAFGMVGTGLSAFGLAGPLVTATIAGLSGLSAGTMAVFVVRQLTERTRTSHGTARDVVGQMGRVVVPFDDTGRGKVRLLVRGSQVDYVAVSNEPLALGERVLVVEMSGHEVQVSKAPRELT